MTCDLTLRYLKSMLHYDPGSGVFTWLVRSSRNIFIGDVAGVCGNGYIVITIDKRPHYAHHLAWFYTYGKWPRQLDHKNGNRRDNRLANLRQATRAQQKWNSGIQSNNTSGFRGVSFNKIAGRYESSIMVNKRKYFLGLFNTAEEAACVYEWEAKKRFGRFKQRRSRQ